MFYLFINKINLYVCLCLLVYGFLVFFLSECELKKLFHYPLFASASLLVGRHKLISTESLFTTMTPSSLPGFASRMQGAESHSDYSFVDGQLYAM